MRGVGCRRWSGARGALSICRPPGDAGLRALTLAGAELGMSRLRQNPICPGRGAAGTQVAEAQETRDALCLGEMSGEGA